MIYFNDKNVRIEKNGETERMMRAFSLDKCICLYAYVCAQPNAHRLHAQLLNSRYEFDDFMCC